MDSYYGLGGAVAVSKEFLEEHPDRVEQFLRGLFKGMAFAAADPANAIDIFAKEYPNLIEDGQSTEDIVPLVENQWKTIAADYDRSGLIGVTPGEEVDRTVDFLSEYGLIPEGSYDGRVDQSTAEAANDFDKKSIAKDAANHAP